MNTNFWKDKRQWEAIGLLLLMAIFLFVAVATSGLIQIVSIVLMFASVFAIPMFVFPRRKGDEKT